MAAGAKGWTILKAEPSIVLVQLDDDGWCRLPRLAFRLRCDGFQLDAGEYGFGLLEFNRKGLALESGSLFRYEHQAPLADTDDAVSPARFLKAYQITATGALRALLRKRELDNDAIQREVIDLGRNLTANTAFDPHDDDQDLGGRVMAFIVTQPGTRPKA